MNSRSAPYIQSQPDVYPFAAYLGERFGCTHVIAIGRPTATNLIQLYPRFEVIGIVPGADLQMYRKQYGFGTWLEESMNLACTPSLPEEVLKRSVILCNDLERFVSPFSLLKSLKTWLDQAPVCILTSADRDLNRAGSNGFPGSPIGPGKWNQLPFYERYGEKQVAAGYYDRVLRYREHIAPLAEALGNYAENSNE